MHIPSVLARLGPRLRSIAIVLSWLTALAAAVSIWLVHASCERHQSELSRQIPVSSPPGDGGSRPDEIKDAAAVNFPVSPPTTASVSPMELDPRVAVIDGPDLNTIKCLGKQ